MIAGRLRLNSPAGNTRKNLKDPFAPKESKNESVRVYLHQAKKMKEQAKEIKEKIQTSRKIFAFALVKCIHVERKRNLFLFAIISLIVFTFLYLIVSVFAWCEQTLKDAFMPKESERDFH